MMKMMAILLVACFFCLFTGATAQGNAVLSVKADAVAIFGTGYQILIPLEWSSSTAADEMQAVLTAEATNGVSKLLVFVDTRTGWNYNSFQEQLVKSSSTNGVSDIQEWQTEERRYIVFRMQLNDWNCWNAATELTDGTIVVLEFRAGKGQTPEEAFGNLLTEIPLSLQIMK